MHIERTYMLTKVTERERIILIKTTSLELATPINSASLSSTSIKVCLLRLHYALEGSLYRLKLFPQPVDGLSCESTR